MRSKFQWQWLVAAAACLGGLSLPARAHDLGVYENVTVEQRALNVGGRPRDVLYLRPTVRASAAPVPAVVLLEYLHGTPADMADLTEASRLVRDNGIVVILPSAANGRWNYGLSSFSFGDDVGFLTSVIDDAIQTLGVDSRRVYMGGYSNGAQMTQRYICDRGEKIAAGAIISGSIHYLDALQCPIALATPMIIFHGTADDQINYNGNLLYRSSVSTAQFWATKAGCTATPTSTFLPDTADDNTTVRFDQYSGCNSGARIDHYNIFGGGHTWPGSLSLASGLGLTGEDVAATPLAWRFFSQFSRP